MTSLPFEDLPQRQAPHDYWDEFWSGWPHKVDKQEAEKEFRKATRKTPARRIIEGRDRYIAAKPDWQAWMGPAKFIRRRRWEDVYTATPPGKPTGTRTPEALAIIADHVKRPWCERGAYSRDVLEQCVAAELLTVDEMEASL